MDRRVQQVQETRASTASAWNDLELYRIAEDQLGYFTTAQAAEAGVDRRVVAAMVKRGTLERTSRGVYRIVNFPPSELSEYIEAALWPHGTTGVVSHESALRLYDLGDVNPSKVHITLPRAFRVRRRACASPGGRARGPRTGGDPASREHPGDNARPDSPIALAVNLGTRPHQAADRSAARWPSNRQREAARARRSCSEPDGPRKKARCARASALLPGIGWDPALIDIGPADWAHVAGRCTRSSSRRFA